MVYAARRLRKYFQGHPINVLTGYKLKNVLSKPELFGRLEKWVIELGEHAIEYKTRPVTKGQVLEDFVTEVPQHKEKECLIEQQPQAPSEQGQIWSLFTDGASSSEGSGACLKLVNPEGHEFTYAIKLDFKSTNNDAEYEAFLAGLQIAKKLGVKHFEARVDSMLIAGQINGTYEAKNNVMASYMSQVKDLMLQFSSCKVIHIKQSENKSADALSKLASTNFEHFAKDIRIEILDRLSVPQHQVLNCEFDARDFVFRNNEASGQEPLGKLAPTWEGPYRVKPVLSKGAYKLEKLDGTEVPRTWNGAQLKKCYI
ncbi:uncharacterized protein LOC143583651 [Bidens hawaiensis]|uniref:uncharacterized protein LOC143583651 n=1 Tax=Bidens hawaiensis TaxID=980011 RepID=UPI00404A3686